MTQLQAVIERISDVEATITSIERDIQGSPSFATRMSLRSLSARRNDLQEELNKLMKCRHLIQLRNK